MKKSIFIILPAFFMLFLFSCSSDTGKSSSDKAEAVVDSVKKNAKTENKKETFEEKKQKEEVQFMNWKGNYIFNGDSKYNLDIFKASDLKFLLEVKGKENYKIDGIANIYDSKVELCFQHVLSGDFNKDHKIKGREVVLTLRNENGTILTDWGVLPVAESLKAKSGTGIFVKNVPAK